MCQEAGVLMPLLFVVSSCRFYLGTLGSVWSEHCCLQLLHAADDTGGVKKCAAVKHFRANEFFPHLLRSLLPSPLSL